MAAAHEDCWAGGARRRFAKARFPEIFASTYYWINAQSEKGRGRGGGGQRIVVAVNSDSDSNSERGGENGEIGEGYIWKKREFGSYDDTDFQLSSFYDCKT